MRKRKSWIPVLKCMYLMATEGLRTQPGGGQLVGMQAQSIPQRLIEAKVAWASPIGPAYHTAAAKERACTVEIEMARSVIAQSVPQRSVPRRAPA